MAARLAVLLGVGAESDNTSVGLPALEVDGVPHVFVLH